MKAWFIAGALALLILSAATGCNRAGQKEEDSSAPAVPQETSAEAVSTDDLLERGRKAYFKHCVACHSPDTDEYVAGISLKGYFDQPPTELSDGTLFPRTDEAIRNLVAEGTQNMPPLIKGITPQELDDILAYMHGL